MKKVSFNILTIAHCLLPIAYCLLPIAYYLLPITSTAQSVSQKLRFAYSQFEKDTQLKHAISSLYIINAKTGQVVFDKNSQIGLTPASTQKILTSVTAFELLGKDYRYKTQFFYAKEKGGNSNSGALYIKPAGDPTLGSWRWNNTKESEILKRVVQSIQKTRINNFSAVIIDKTGWETESIQNGWIWQDIGNYYGAGSEVLNWRENRFDIILKSGKSIGDPVEIVCTVPKLQDYDLVSVVSSAAKGTGDKAYVYFPLNRKNGTVRGTIPVNENRFIISGAFPSASGQFIGTLLDSLNKIGVTNPMFALQADKNSKDIKINLNDFTLLHTEVSPSLDSIIYWFNKKSINLYGEALVKTMAYVKKGSTDSGIVMIKNFWKEKGINPNELNIFDGSGLSPLNRVTTQAQVEVLKYAKQQQWFNSLINSFPESNGMKIKSGTIRNVKGYTGYHIANDGNEYIFSFLVNNYNGSASALTQKMFKVLDILK